MKILPLITHPLVFPNS